MYDDRELDFLLMNTPIDETDIDDDIRYDYYGRTYSSEEYNMYEYDKDEYFD